MDYGPQFDYLLGSKSIPKFQITTNKMVDMYIPLKKMLSLKTKKAQL